jgi:AAA ATPase-like protein
MEYARTARVDHRRLLERHRELEVLDGLLGAATGGAGALVVIEGPAGIGKTSLLDEVRRRAVEIGGAVLAARCSELEVEFAFGVVRQLMEPVVHEDGRSSALFRGAAGLAAPLLHVESAAGFAPRGVNSADQPGAVVHGLYWLTANLAERRWLVIAVDDLQWADYVGKDVALAARICDAARGGEILVSSQLRAIVDPAEGLAFDDGRKACLKGLTGHYLLFGVGWNRTTEPSSSRHEITAAA